MKKLTLALFSGSILFCVQPAFSTDIAMQAMCAVGCGDTTCKVRDIKVLCNDMCDLKCVGVNTVVGSDEAIEAKKIFCDNACKDLVMSAIESNLPKIAPKFKSVCKAVCGIQF